MSVDSQGYAYRVFVGGRNGFRSRGAAATPVLLAKHRRVMSNGTRIPKTRRTQAVRRVPCDTIADEVLNRNSGCGL